MGLKGRKTRVITGIAATILASSGFAACGQSVAGATSIAAKGTLAVKPSLAWSIKLPASVAMSSPSPDTVDGVAAALVGTTAGKVYALRMSNGKTLPGWPATVPGSLPVDSTPSVTGSSIFVGVGSAGKPTGGGYLALTTTGRERWFKQVHLEPSKGPMSSVSASLALAKIQGTATVVAGTLGQQMGAFTTNGATKAGFPWYAADTELSTPAVSDLEGNNDNEIIEGGASTAGVSYGTTYKNGGHIRVLKATGNKGQSKPNGGLVCQYNTTQEVDSSPAIGHVLAGDDIGIVAGTGSYFKGASDTDALIMLTTDCKKVWEDHLAGLTGDSPALVDAKGNGYLQVAEGGGDTAYLIDGSNGHTEWSHNVGHAILGGITSANLGGGHQDLLVPTVNGIYVLNGQTGAKITVLDAAVGFQNSPLVTDDSNGTIGVTAAGYNAAGGVVAHWDFSGTEGSLADETGAWPMFHHDPLLTGSTLPRITGSPSA